MARKPNEIPSDECPEPGWHETHRYCPCCSWTEDENWTPRYLVRKAPGVGGDPIPDDEPVLVIRAQDRMAIEMMQTYIERYQRDSDHDPAVVRDLESHKRRLIGWQSAHPEKVKKADR